MNIDRIINMVIRMFVRKAVNKGMNAGINKLAGAKKGKPGAPLTPEEQAAQKQANANAARMKKGVKLGRRMGRF